jgi:hypothetical protein
MVHLCSAGSTSLILVYSLKDISFDLLIASEQHTAVERKSKPWDQNANEAMDVQTPIY